MVSERKLILATFLVALRAEQQPFAEWGTLWTYQLNILK
jgi:hypothetical protein